MTVTLIDPTLGPSGDGDRMLAARPASLDGAVIGLVNNGKARGREILQRVAENLTVRHRIGGTILVTKPDSSFPATPADVEMLAADATAIIAAIGD